MELLNADFHQGQMLHLATLAKAKFKFADSSHDSDLLQSV